MNCFGLFLLGWMLLLSGGCNLLTPRQTEADLLREQQVIREREQRKFYEEQHRKSQQGLEDVESELYRMQTEVARVRTDLSENQATDIQRLDRRISQLESDIRELEKRRKQDRDEIVDILSKRIAEVIQLQQAQQARQYQATAASGQEHVVARGETLSAIAAAYGVRSDDIIRLNRIDNPNALRVGQKLIIPR